MDYIQLLRESTETTLTISCPVHISENPNRGEVDHVYEVCANVLDDYPEFDNFRLVRGPAIDFKSLDSIIEAYSKPSPLSRSNENRS